MDQLHTLCNKSFPVMGTMELTIGDVLRQLEEGSGEAGPDDLIMAIDLSQARTEFSINLIKRLFRSLRTDLDREEGKELLKQLKAINKELK